MSGKYKGAHVVNTAFIKDLEPYVDISTTCYDMVYDLMLRIKNRSNYQCPVVTNYIGINDHSSKVNEPVSELLFNDE